MAERCIFLAGSPTADELVFDNECLLNTLDLPVRRFLGEAVASTIPDPAEVSSWTVPKWRTLRDDSIRLQPQHDNQPATQFLVIPEPTVEANLSFRTAFHNHVLTQLELLASSTIPDPTVTDWTATTFSLEDSTNLSITTTSSISDTQPSNPNLGTLLSIPAWLRVTDIASLPNARAINTTIASLTYNLIATLIAVLPAQTRTTKYGKKEITDIIVADNTRAALTITIWSNAGASDNPLRNAISRLQPGNVVLIRNVEMAAFRGNVHGRSVMARRGIGAGGLTGVFRVDDGAEMECTREVREKIGRVKRHALRYVVSDHGAEGARNRAKKTIAEALPPDTQT